MLTTQRSDLGEQEACTPGQRRAGTGRVNGMGYWREHKQRLWIVLADLLLALTSYLAAYLIRFEGQIPPTHLAIALRALPFLLALRLACCIGFGLYRRVWVYASLTDLFAVVRAVTVGSAVFSVLLFSDPFRGHSRGILIMDWLILILLVGGVRVALRVYRRGLPPRRPAAATPSPPR